MTAASSLTSLTTLRIAGLLGIGTLGLTACAAEVEADPATQQEAEATEHAEGTDADEAAGEAAAQHAEEKADVELGPLEQTEVEDLLIDPSDLSFSSPTEIRSTGGSIREELHMLGAVASGFSREAVEDNPGSQIRRRSPARTPTCTWWTSWTIRTDRTPAASPAWPRTRSPRPMSPSRSS